ncbi:hypothetical protein Xcc3_35380 [Xanthomonas campestris pv. campestris]|nr:hypothetical protein Xcc1_34700 [Xanthomonas campestris pv. campestris]BBK02231.1 hypothetical protein Xcc3_35380 [Xanthomonas campestris pv. campestris]
MDAATEPPWTDSRRVPLPDAAPRVSTKVAHGSYRGARIGHWDARAWKGLDMPRKSLQAPTQPLPSKRSDTDTRARTSSSR